MFAAATDIPRKRRRHYSYDESVDEPGKLIDDEPVEVEQEIPADENEPLQRVTNVDEPHSRADEE